VLDHAALFGCLHAALRPGGQLVAQCGGEGNIDRLRGIAGAVLEREPYAEHFRDWRSPWYYAAPEPTRERLLEAGFTAAECWLAPAPQYPEQPREFLAKVILGPHVQRLPEDLRDPFLDAVLEEVGESSMMVDYVRLNIDAIG
jgi:trans-aconitate 2-methyltransferase